jgi:hypothetical protein
LVQAGEVRHTVPRRAASSYADTVVERILGAVLVVGLPVLAGLVTLRFAHSTRFHRFQEFFHHLDNPFRWRNPSQEKYEADYRQQTGIHTGPLMIAVLFFLIAGVGLLAIVLN